MAGETFKVESDCSTGFSAVPTVGFLACTKLTPGWKKETHGDKILYVNHAEKSFSWVPPVAMEDAHAGKLEAGQAEMAPEDDFVRAVLQLLEQ